MNKIEYKKKVKYGQVRWQPWFFLPSTERVKNPLPVGAHRVISGIPVGQYTRELALAPTV